MDDNEKCNCLQFISEKWPEPFGKPIRFNTEDGQISAGEWAVKVYELNPSGTIKSKSLSHLMLSYCPICGCKLVEPKKTETKEEDAHD